jgi:hypothetical protein
MVGVDYIVLFLTPIIRQQNAYASLDAITSNKTSGGCL